MNPWKETSSIALAVPSCNGTCYGMAYHICSISNEGTWNISGPRKAPPLPCEARSGFRVGILSEWGINLCPPCFSSSSFHRSASYCLGGGPVSCCLGCLRLSLCSYEQVSRCSYLVSAREVVGIRASEEG